MYFYPYVCSLDTSTKSLFGSNSTKGIFTFFSHTHCGENSSNTSMLIRFKRLWENITIINTRTEKKNPNELGVSMLSIKKPQNK